MKEERWVGRKREKKREKKEKGQRGRQEEEGEKFLESVCDSVCVCYVTEIRLSFLFNKHIQESRVLENLHIKDFTGVCNIALAFAICFIKKST